MNNIPSITDTNQYSNEVEYDYFHHQAGYNPYSHDIGKLLNGISSRQITGAGAVSFGAAQLLLFKSIEYVYTDGVLTGAP